MTDSAKTSKPVPVSSSRNGFKNARAMTILAVIVAFLLIAIFVPW